MTAITPETANKRFHQGLMYLMGLTADPKAELNREEICGVVSVMAYLGAYAYPEKNYHGLKQVLSLALEFLASRTDVNVIIETSMRNAEAFRRPWTEEPSPGQTIKTI